MMDTQPGLCMYIVHSGNEHGMGVGGANVGLFKMSSDSPSLFEFTSQERTSRGLHSSPSDVSLKVEER